MGRRHLLEELEHDYAVRGLAEPEEELVGAQRAQNRRVGAHHFRQLHADGLSRLPDSRDAFPEVGRRLFEVPDGPTGAQPLQQVADEADAVFAQQFGRHRRGEVAQWLAVRHAGPFVVVAQRRFVDSLAKAQSDCLAALVEAQSSVVDEREAVASPGPLRCGQTPLVGLPLFERQVAASPQVGLADLDHGPVPHD